MTEALSWDPSKNPKMYSCCTDRNLPAGEYLTSRVVSLLQTVVQDRDSRDELLHCILHPAGKVGCACVCQSRI